MGGEHKPKRPGVRKSAKVLFAETTPAPSGKSGPKIFFGAKARTRIPCSLKDLKALDTTAEESVLEQALRVVARVNLDDMYFEDVMKFGARLQAKHAEITEQDLELARTSALPEAQNLHVSILAQLRGLDPAKVFGLQENWFQRMLRKLFGKGLTVDQVFALHYPRVEALAASLHALEPTLTQQREGLATLGQQYEALNQEISGYILAVQFITDYVHGDRVEPKKKALYISHIDAIADRKDSLRITSVTLTSGQLNTALSIKNMERLIAAGRRLLDQNLPSFQTAYSIAIAAARRGAMQDKSWLQSLRNSYKDLVENITEKGE